MATAKQNPKRFKWALDFAHKNKQDRNTDIPAPPGYTSAVALFHNVESLREANPNHLIIKKSWDLALAPLRQIMVNLVIMYMAGNSISIFPIMMVGMLIVRPVKGLFTLQQTFKVIEGSRVHLQKIVYFLGQLVNLMLALYKCQSMGLLPTHASDWLAFVEPQARVEYSGGGLIYT
ncbi:hypothetical protein KM043_014686 [Ampulex compressa]|nr:hypothetical protein KM043_014686 [Ampulex compressa]